MIIYISRVYLLCILMHATSAKPWRTNKIIHVPSPVWNQPHRLSQHLLHFQRRSNASSSYRSLGKLIHLSRRGRQNTNGKLKTPVLYGRVDEKSGQREAALKQGHSAALSLSLAHPSPLRVFGSKLKVSGNCVAVTRRRTTHFPSLIISSLACTLGFNKTFCTNGIGCGGGCEIANSLVGRLRGFEGDTAVCRSIIWV